MSLVIRNARLWDGTSAAVAMTHGRITAVGEVPPGLPELDAKGATLLPGLHDHHLHVLASAARANSLDLSEMSDEVAVMSAVAATSGGTIRAVGYDERTAGLPDRVMLDRWSSDRPLRVQDRTGALWVLNSAALALLPHSLPPGAQLDERGNPTGRFWREDRWLGAHFPRSDLDLPAFGRHLASLGLTGLTDAGAHNGPDEAVALTDVLPQNLTIMGGEALPEGAGYVRGPLKLLIDERDPPMPDFLGARILEARRQGRRVAAHCVTAVELALFLAGLEIAGGAVHGDRIEHGGMISDSALRSIATTPLTVVTNPSFIYSRGDRYLATMEQAEFRELYRAGSLLKAGIALAAGSDAPYAPEDPWLGMRTARDRMSARGHSISRDERLSALAALNLYLGAADDPGGPARRIAVNEPANLILCDGAPADILADLSAQRVAATIIAGNVVFARD